MNFSYDELFNVSTFINKNLNILYELDVLEDYLKRLRMF